MVAGFWMIVFAIIFDVIGVGKRQWANRIAAVLALGAMVRILAPSKLGQQLRQWANDAADAVGSAVGSYDPQWGRLVASVGVAAVSLLVIVVWLWKFFPKHDQLGDASSKELSSKWIWGGAVVSALFVSTIPGTVGEILVAITGLGTRLADAGIDQTGVALAVRLATGVAF